MFSVSKPYEKTYISSSHYSFFWVANKTVNALNAKAFIHEYIINLKHERKVTIERKIKICAINNNTIKTCRIKTGAFCYYTYKYFWFSCAVLCNMQHINVKVPIVVLYFYHPFSNSMNWTFCKWKLLIHVSYHK